MRGDEYTSSATVMAILAGTVLVRAAMACSKQILFGIQEVKFLARNSIATAILNVLLSCVMIYWLGLVGVAISSVFAFAVMQLWFQPRFLSKCIDKPVWSFMVPALWIVALGSTVTVAQRFVRAYREMSLIDAGETARLKEPTQ